MIEYPRRGLPILSAIKGGYLAELLAKHECGDIYDGDPDKFAALLRLLRFKRTSVA